MAVFDGMILHLNETLRRYKMNFKKLLILGLAALMSVSTLAACSDSEEGETTTETKAPTQTETTTRYNYLANMVAQYVSFDANLYTDMKLTVPSSLQIKDEDVQSYIDYIRFENRTAVNGETQIKDIEVKNGDDAFIYYKGFVGGKEFEGGSNWDDASPYQLGIGSQTFIPGFEDGLLGVIPNTTSKNNPYKLTVTFPEDYQNEELAGKEAEFHVVIEYVVQYNVPAYTLSFITDTLKYEFKKEFYASDRARFDEFEGVVREELEASSAQDLQNAKSDALWNYLISNATFSWLPETEVNYYYTNYVEELKSIYEYYSASSVNGEEFKAAYPTVDKFAVAYLGLKSDADWLADMKRRAEDIVKKDMLGHAIGEIEGLETVSEDEFSAQVKYWAEQYKDYGMSEDDVISSMGEDTLKEMAFSEKIEAWLMKRATFTYANGESLDGTASETETEAESENVAESEVAEEADSDAESESV